MSLLRRKAAPTPARAPHPDPGMEAQLQRIIALRESAARKEALSCQYAEEIGELSCSYRMRLRDGQNDAAILLENRLKDLQGEIRDLETEIAQVHDDIAKRTQDLSDADLAYL